jgi:hypothetical protein
MLVGRSLRGAVECARSVRIVGERVGLEERVGMFGRGQVGPRIRRHVDGVAHGHGTECVAKVRE